MNKYYTRACNFYFGSVSKNNVKKNKSIPLHGNTKISFDKIEIIGRKKNKIINIRDISKLSTKLKKKVNRDLKKYKKKENFQTNKFIRYPYFDGHS